jgi:hypothetical protein
MRNENPPRQGEMVQRLKGGGRNEAQRHMVYRVKRTSTFYSVFYLKDKVEVKDRGVEEKIVERLMDKPDKQV